MSDLYQVMSENMFLRIHKQPYSIYHMNPMYIWMERKIWVLQPFQEYFTYIEPMVNQRWAKTRVPRRKTT